MTMGACSGRDPVAADANNVANAPAAEIDVLPPDESDATPTNELEIRCGRRVGVASRRCTGKNPRIAPRPLGHDSRRLHLDAR